MISLHLGSNALKSEALQILKSASALSGSISLCDCDDFGDSSIRMGFSDSHQCVERAGSAREVGAALSRFWKRPLHDTAHVRALTLSRTRSSRSVRVSFSRPPLSSTLGTWKQSNRRFQKCDFRSGLLAWNF